MNCAAKVSMFCLLAVTLVGATSQAGAAPPNPVSRVIELLQALEKQTEKEGKIEEGLYEDFVCWGQSVIRQKTASNAEARSEISDLKAYLGDLDSGRVELTSERTDLEKDVSTLMDDMESANAMRKKENEDFEMAKEEMSEAIDALNDAIATLKDATAAHKEGVLLAIKDAAENGGMAKLLQRQAALNRAVKLGENFLDKADATFLRRVLLGEVPKVDYKKLNRKATFKMSYKARSFKIQDTLIKMRDNFKKNLKDAEKKEADAVKAHKELTTAKGEQLATTQTALRKMDSENGAKGLSKRESEERLARLETQVDDDSAFIEETKKALSDKAASWKTRSELRAQELSGISKAIEVLHNDDDRDLFTRSFASHEKLDFLQVRQKSHKAATHRGQKAAVALKDAALRSGDKRLVAIAVDFAEGYQPRLSAGGKSVKTNFDPVIMAIEKMVGQLAKEEEKDLEEKEFCEKDRMNNTRFAIGFSRDMDEMSDEITKFQAIVDESSEQVKRLQVEYDKVQAALTQANRTREDEMRAFALTDKDDEEAAKTVKRAIVVLSEFYKDKLALLQKGKQPVTDMNAGDGPPPPPPTWEGGYGGKQGEAQGIVAIMEMVHEDILKDKHDAEVDEEASAKEFADFEEDSNDRLGALAADIQANTDQEGDALLAKVSMTKKRADAGKRLNSVIETMQGVDPNCEYYEVNYPMRKRNRQIEMDGLNKAKAILEGGVFNEGPDPDREIKPGDAASSVFLQRRSRA